MTLIWICAARMRRSSEPVQVFISFNVLGLRRFCAANEHLRKQVRGAKMCRSNGVGVSEATDLAVAQAKPATVGEA
jgi:hypothetical protein